jgi:hypothetical protein
MLFQAGPRGPGRSWHAATCLDPYPCHPADHLLAHTVESRTPTTELVLSHKHPDDNRQVADTLQLIRQTCEAFRSRHRIRDLHGKVHDIAVLGDELQDEDGRVIGTYGFYVDLTPEERARQDRMSAEPAHISERRSAIDQAKGMLMMVYNVDDATAFELLKWRSQETNVKLALLAEQIVCDFMGMRHNGEMSRSTCDQLFLTAHDRVGQGRG